MGSGVLNWCWPCFWSCGLVSCTGAGRALEVPVACLPDEPSDCNLPLMLFSPVYLRQSLGRAESSGEVMSSLQGRGVGVEVRIGGSALSHIAPSQIRGRQLP